MAAVPIRPLIICFTKVVTSSSLATRLVPRITLYGSSIVVAATPAMERVRSRTILIGLPKPPISTGTVICISGASAPGRAVYPVKSKASVAEA